MLKDYDIETFTTMRLTEYMKLYHVSIKKLHEVTGIARTTIARYVNGTTIPTLYFLGQFLDYIQVSAAEFFAPYIAKQNNFAV